MHPLFGLHRLYLHYHCISLYSSLLRDHSFSVHTPALPHSTTKSIYFPSRWHTKYVSLIILTAVAQSSGQMIWTSALSPTGHPEETTLLFSGSSTSSSALPLSSSTSSFPGSSYTVWLHSHLPLPYLTITPSLLGHILTSHLQFLASDSSLYRKLFSPPEHPLQAPASRELPFLFPTVPW